MSQKDGLTGRVRGLATTLLRDPRVQNWRGNLREQTGGWRGQFGSKAEERLETLIRGRREERGEAVPEEVGAALTQRRREWEARAEQRRFEAELLAQAQSPEERWVLSEVLRSRPEQPPRYTALLDRLAPSGDPAREMAVHRALWSLAERGLLAVSSHGQVTLAARRP